MGSLISSLFKTHEVKSNAPVTGGQVVIGVFGILALIAVAVFSPLWYWFKIQPFDSNLLDNPACEIQAFDWVQLGMGNGPVNLQYAHDKIEGVMEKCEDGTEFDWVLWTVEDARIIMWGSGATGVWARINTGAKSHHGGAISFVDIWCINTFTHGVPLQVQVSPTSNFLEPRQVTFSQDASTGPVQCTIDAETLAQSAVDSVKKVHSSGDYCKSVASKIPVVCRTFDWAGCVAFMLSSWGFVTSVINVLIKRSVNVPDEITNTKAGEA